LQHCLYRDRLSRLKLSGIERALLGLLAEVVDENLFTTAYELFEGMTARRPNVLKRLLGDCRNNLYFRQAELLVCIIPNSEASSFLKLNNLWIPINDRKK